MLCAYCQVQVKCKNALVYFLFVYFRKKKSSSRMNSGVDYTRSISMPPDKAKSNIAQKKHSEPSLPGGTIPSSPEIE